MGSLARLVRKIPNMAIPQEIRSDVLLTLSHLDKVLPRSPPTPPPNLCVLLIIRRVRRYILPRSMSRYSIRH